MENFNINLVGETFKIEPLKDGTYKVNLSPTIYAILVPKITDEGVIWKSEGMNKDLVRQIGELIEEHDM